MLVAVLLAAGFVGEGMMFVNQAAASAILVVALRGHGIGGERALDALVGGAVALIVGVILFPASPLPRLWDAERAVLRSLAYALEQAADLLRTGARAEPMWAVATDYEIHEQLSILAQARMTARANVRIAPRRWRLRPVVDAADQRIAPLELVANSTLSLVRALTVAAGDREAPPAPLQARVAPFASALRALSDTPQPWPESVIRRALNVAHDVSAGPTVEDRSPVVASSLRAAARDLLEFAHAVA
jgi:uncharacterized membrane protein YgaE (UPF0421/DUF939 family)